MFEVKIVNGEGEQTFGPFEDVAAAQTEKERWISTGGCTSIEIRPIAVTNPVAQPVAAESDDAPKPPKRK